MKRGVGDAVFIVGLALILAYEVSPDMQSWVNYQGLRARQWVTYGLDWARWAQRRARKRQET